MEIPCSACGGTGLVGGESCLQCSGDGLEEVTGVHEVGHGYMIAAQTNLLALIETISEIKVEQASQREDLTAALTQIWNKVKDL